MHKPVHPILIAGPTAAGKSALALALAEMTDGWVINADALQVYRCWQVLSARPTTAELARAPHFLYGHVACDAPYSTGHWLREVAELLAQAQAAGKRPIIIGGTGLYFSALTKGLAEIPDIDTKIRLEGNALREEGKVNSLLDYLQENDPDTHAQIDRLNPVRVQRAWEVHRSSGIGLAAWHRKTPPPLVPLESATCLVLDAERDWLAERIDRRFVQMVETGALDEVQRVMDAGHATDLPAMQAIGASELAAYLRGETSLNDAITLGCSGSRQYAKRQRTWFRNRFKAWQRVDAPNIAQNAIEIHKTATAEP